MATPQRFEAFECACKRPMYAASSGVIRCTVCGLEPAGCSLLDNALDELAEDPITKAYGCGGEMAGALIQAHVKRCARCRALRNITLKVLGGQR